MLMFTTMKPLSATLFFFMLMTLAFLKKGNACSGYKITMGDKTLFGSNEDAWRLTPHIWFETGTGAGHYGAAFTGSRYDGENGYAPQTGMNEMGLVFERLVSYHPKQKKFANRKSISNPTLYLKDIIHTCKTVEEVKEYISQYDHSYFIEDVFIYADKSGKYLIVEPYVLTIGDDPSYVFSNFCPSITSNQKAQKITRYRNGVAFLKNNLDTTLGFCKALSDTMHVCRNKIGDGTLLTSIWDLHGGKVNLYFYHDYKTSVQFDLQQELKKGNHIISIDTLFPPNSEFDKLCDYKIPTNSLIMRVFIVLSGGFFFLTAIFFLIQYFIRRKHKKYAYLQLLLFPLGLILLYYMFVLSGPIHVFYFPAPYKDPGNIFVSLSSYIPFLVAFLIIPFCVINRRILKESSWNFWAKGLFTLNNFVYIMLIGLFIYWRFYHILS